MAQYTHKSIFNKTSADALFGWHETPQAFKRLLPPWEPVTIAQVPTELKNDSRAELHIPLLGRLGKNIPIVAKWIARHHAHIAGRQFVDTQVSGPFAAWQHLHQTRDMENGAELCDDIHYALPLSPISHWIAEPFVHAKLSRMFRFRHRITQYDVSRMNPELVGKRVLITGASGFVGGHLVAFLLAMGMRVRVLLRDRPEVKEARWNGVELYTLNADNGSIPQDVFEDVDTVITLNGETIAQKWTPESKQRILQSRIDWNTKTVEACLASEHRPASWIAASGISVLPDHATLDETRYNDQARDRNTGFLGEVADAWEGTLKPFENTDIRTCILRIGIIMDESGGYMKALTLPYQYTGVNTIDDGTAPLPWVSLEDVLGIIQHLMANENSSGPYNICAPDLCDIKTFHKAWATAIGMPFVGAFPSALLSLVFGKDMVDACMLQGVPAVPQKLKDEGFEFLHPTLDKFFNHAVDIHGWKEWVMSKL